MARSRPRAIRRAYADTDGFRAIRPYPVANARKPRCGTLRANWDAHSAKYAGVSFTGSGTGLAGVRFGGLGDGIRGAGGMGSRRFRYGPQAMGNGQRLT